nr:Rieske 2Fe-2S domain-containing protein [Mycobacteroides abscessus]
MADGWIDRGRIVCPWHGSQFDTSTGCVVCGPASTPLPCYQTRINNGYIELHTQTTPQGATTESAALENPSEPTCDGPGPAGAASQRTGSGKKHSEQHQPAISPRSHNRSDQTHERQTP